MNKCLATVPNMKVLAIENMFEMLYECRILHGAELYDLGDA